MMPNRRRAPSWRSRPRPPRPSANDDLFGKNEDEPEKGRDHLFLWTVGILLLVGAALTAWLGAFYIFGHPEKPESYRLLQKFGKVPLPARFELTAAPPGEFLTAQKAFERYGGMSRYQLERENEGLLRDFIRNYQNTKRLVPYLTGRYTIMSSYGLKESDFVGSGMVAVAQSAEMPQVVIEHIYPAKTAAIPTLEQMLATGLDLKLERANDLAAVIHIDRMPDGRLQFTVVPLIYGSYALAQGGGNFSLDPPPHLNPAGGLPVIRDQLLEDCLQRYATMLRERNTRLAAQRREQEIPVAQPAEGTTITQVAPPRPEEKQETAAITEESSSAVALTTPSPTPAEESAAPAATPQPEPSPSPTPAVADATPDRAPILQPFLVSAPTPSVSEPSRRWRTYPPGQMPRGRLVTLSEADELANRGVGGERLYLRGDFTVTATRENRAVLRATRGLENFGRGERAPRIIVEFPDADGAPMEREQISRDGMRPFEVRDVRRGNDGQITIFVREVTTQ